jgi:hypothetical protein
VLSVTELEIAVLRRGREGRAFERVNDAALGSPGDAGDTAPGDGAAADGNDGGDGDAVTPDA